MATQLSKYFTLEMFTNSSTATSMGIDNTPTAAALVNLTALAQLLDTTYDTFGPFQITSGYRSPALNAAIGGAPNSYHEQGLAADLAPFDSTPYAYFLSIISSDSATAYGEIINEADDNGIVHLSLPTAAKVASIMYLQGGNYYIYTPAEIAALTAGQTPDTSQNAVDVADADVEIENTLDPTTMMVIFGATVLMVWVAFEVNKQRKRPDGTMAGWGEVLLGMHEKKKKPAPTSAPVAQSAPPSNSAHS